MSTAAGEDPAFESDLAAGFEAMLGCGRSFRRELKKSREQPQNQRPSPIKAFRTAVEADTPRNVELPGRLCDLASSLTRRLEKRGALRAVNMAVSQVRTVVDLIPQEDSRHPFYLGHLRTSLQNHLPVTSPDLAEGLSSSSADDPDRRSWARNLGNVLLSAFEQKEQDDSSSESASIQHEVETPALEEESRSAVSLTDLGMSLLSRYERISDSSNLSQAIESQKSMVSMRQPSKPDQAASNDGLNVSLQLRFNRIGELSDLADAVSTMETEVQLTSDERGFAPDRLNEETNSFDTHYERTGRFPDVIKAVSIVQKAISLTHRDYSKLPSFLKDVWAALLSRRGESRDYHNLMEALDALQQAITTTPSDCDSGNTRLNELIAIVVSQLLRSGVPPANADVLSSLVSEVQLGSDGRQLAGVLLDNLGPALREHLPQTYDAPDASALVPIPSTTMYLTPGDNEPTPMLCGDTFSDILTSEAGYGHGGDAVQTLIPTYRGSRNLENVLSHISEGSGELRDISDTYSVFTQAGLFNARGDYGLAATISTLLQMAPGNSSTSSVHPNLLNGLAVSFLRRCGFTPDLFNAAEAIGAFEEAIALTPGGRVDLRAISRRCVEVLRERFVKSGAGLDITASLSPSSDSPGKRRLRIGAATEWSRPLVDHRPHSADIIPAYDTAIDMFALTAGLEQTMRHRYSQLYGISGLPLESAAVACQIGRPDKALEWLEQGRCQVWSQLNTLHSPLDELRLHHSSLADSIEEVSMRLAGAGVRRGTAGGSSLGMVSARDEARAHLDNAKEWHNLMGIVRSTPGFETFLKPSPCSSLMKSLPETGVVVVIGVHQNRCDAIALMSGMKEPFDIPLPNFSLEKANKYRAALRKQLGTHGLRMRAEAVGDDRSDEERLARPYRRKREVDVHVLRDILRDLWNEVVNPILTALEFQKIGSSSSQSLPRIWWCPTGALSFLPLHAAGIYGAAESENLPRYAVSSYIPTVSSLAERVKSCKPVDQNVSGLFLTSQPNGIPTSRIPGTTVEAKCISTLALQHGVRMLNLEGDDIEIADCLEYMESYSSIHFACHASQNADDPLKSRFQFHKGSLDLATIIQRKLKNADLAFLSACQTSTGDENLSDEAVHLAAGMLTAGYRRVVATMWAIGDRHAPDVAHDFYEYLWSNRVEGSEQGFDGSLSAYALHNATERLRQRLGNDSEQSFLAWVPYVHFGY